jgi:hypothetical protein
MHISRLASELIYDYNDLIPKTAFMHDSVVYECRFCWMRAPLSTCCFSANIQLILHQCSVIPKRQFSQRGYDSKVNGANIPGFIPTMK